MRHAFRSIAAAALVAIAALLPHAAVAQPCVGFTDVDTGSPFCANVEWLKNREITLGCTTTLYCPNDPVSRLAMAAFMNRLGNALTPVQLRRDAAPGALDPDASPVVCQTNDFAVTGFPRHAYVDLSFVGTAPADVDLNAALVSTIDNGATWTNLNTTLAPGSILANRWGSFPDVGERPLDVGQTVRFGVRVTRAGAGTADVADSRCQLRALIYSRTGATSPR